MLSSNYQNNLKTLQNIDLVLATKIIQASQAHTFELSIVSEEHQLFNIYDSFQETYLYENIIDELKAEVKYNDRIATQSFIYLYGISNTYALALLLNNKNHERIVIIEPELEILFVALHLFDFSKYLKSGKLQIISAKGFTNQEALALFKHTPAKHHARSFELIITCNYYKKYFDTNIKDIHHILSTTLTQSITQCAQDFKETLKEQEQTSTHIKQSHQFLQTLNIQEFQSFLHQNIENEDDIKHAFTSLYKLKNNLYSKKELQSLLYPSSLAYFIELAHIQTRTVKSIAMKQQQDRDLLQMYQHYFAHLQECCATLIDLELNGEAVSA